MPDGSSSPRAVLLGAEPQLFVADIPESCDFFIRKLGFAVSFVHGDPPYYAQVVRDGARLNLRCVERPVVDEQVRQRDNLLSAAITLASAADIRRLFDEYQAAGVAFFQNPRREPWDALTFIVQDPDGNLLLFAAPAR